MDRFQGCSAILKTLKKKELAPSLKLMLNILILILVGIPVLLFATVVSPQQRGFYCNDASLSYPIISSTISTTALVIGGLLIPIVSILIVDTIKGSSDIQSQEEFLKKCLPPKIITIFTSIGYFLFGCGCIQTITDIAKYNIGRLRPHFHAVCQTDWNSIQTNCSSLHPVYIYPIPCLNPDHHAVREAELSFFSGHASFSSFTMIYLIFYLENRLTFHNPALLKPLIQFLCLVITVYTSLSRVFDYHHHWSDVLFGFIMGGTVAYLIARYVSGLIGGDKKHEQKTNDVETA
ncbi:unnamed protein product [Meganyctiphanes norvegica]|uniref:Phosphatidic acid phosphatase type 2/haloperoxidase domain-containing protein n=1 Tax=Meganyctiphanes norvegica TaxID=48144 RepID=A0AAV2QZ83_MEGNR